jgi:hypothetical protein
MANFKFTAGIADETGKFTVHVNDTDGHSQRPFSFKDDNV